MKKSSFESDDYSYSFSDSESAEVDTAPRVPIPKINPKVEYLKRLTFDQIWSDIKQSAKNMDFLISHASSFKENWDFLIMITACWNVFMLPISIAFKTESEATEMINVFVDICFLLDIIIVFRTTILDDDSGEEIKDWRIIARRYLYGRFTIDFLSTVPFDKAALVSSPILMLTPTYRSSWTSNQQSNSSFSAS